MTELKSVMNYDDYFKDEQTVRRAIASYYALVSFLDDNIGKVLAAIEAAGLTELTRVIYASDHGDNLGCRGLWGKSVMYEELAAIPMVVAGAGVTPGGVVDTPVSLVDCYSKTVLEAVGCPVSVRRQGAAVALAVGDCRRRASRSQRAVGVSRRRVDHRDLHDPLWPLEVCPSRRIQGRSSSTLKAIRAKQRTSRNGRTWPPF